MLVTYIICGRLERRNEMSWIIDFIKNIFGVKEEKDKPKKHKKREPFKPKPIKGLNPKKKKAKGRKQGNMS